MGTVMNGYTNKKRSLHIVIATLTFILGVLVYVLDRNPQQIYFLTGFLNHPLTDGSVFGAIGSSLPSFTHVYAFILFTAALLPPGRKAYLGATLAWLATDSAFEIAQHPAIAPIAASAVPDWFAGIPVLENTRNYLLHSTFDYSDLAAIAMGAIAAAVTILITTRQKGTTTDPTTNVDSGEVTLFTSTNQ
ncbi:MAG: hypothetical protein PVJ39_03330 [Gammaproteobacteria bacterium]